MNYCNPEGFRNEIKELLARGDIDAFYNWFDGGETKAGAFEKGDDVFNRVIFPLAEKHLPKGDCTCLDLGYGGGTKIEAALDHFSIVYGVDVHDEFEFVSKNLTVPEGKEIRLGKGTGDDIPIGSEIIDFVYSWTTFCHIGTIDNVKKYLEEIYRVLKPGGVAALFFTRLMRPKGPQSWREVEVDIQREKEHLDGYREGGPLSKVRSINLVISMWKMVELVEAAGFVSRKMTASWDDGPSGKRQYHGQYGLVITKPKPKPVEKRGNKPGSAGGGGRKPKAKKVVKTALKRRKNG